MLDLSTQGDRTAASRYRLAFERSPQPAWFCDPGLRLTEVNDALCELLGEPREALLGRRLPELTHPEDRARDAQDLALVCSGERTTCAREKRILRGDDRPLWALVVLSAMHDAAGRLRYLSGSATDVTEHHARERRLRHLADHDPLTGLLNRRGFGRELRRHLSRLARYGVGGALLMVDLDNFKGYNDANGHPRGDALLQEVAGALQSRLRGGDVVGRVGGDEFAVLLTEATVEQAEVVGAAIVEAVRELGRSDDPHVTASVGVYPLDAHDALSEGQAMVGADLAMYAAKHSGRDRYAPFPMDIRHRIAHDVGQRPD